MDSLDLRKIIVIFSLLIVISFGIGLYIGKTYLATSIDNNEVKLQPVQEFKPTKIKVYVTGEVKHPDVYEFDENSIVKDAIVVAGGPTENADLVAVNLAKKLADGEEVIVPSKEVALNENSATSTSTKASTSKNSKININRATKEELMSLPGIGEVKAQAIIDYRTKNGPFKSVHDIVNVSGIGEKTFEKIQDLITV